MSVYLRNAVDLDYLFFRPFVAFEKSVDEKIEKIEVRIREG
jgi:hypothetical protein